MSRSSSRSGWQSRTSSRPTWSIAARSNRTPASSSSSENCHAAARIVRTGHGTEPRLLLREGKAEDQVSSPAASLAAARRHRDEFLAVHHVDGGRREDPGTRVELPERLAGLRIGGKEVGGDVAAAPDTHPPPGGDGR